MMGSASSRRSGTGSIWTITGMPSSNYRKVSWTTDPERHSGEGIYFTSRFFDKFGILSSGLYFEHTSESDDWLIEFNTGGQIGTSVMMAIGCSSQRTVNEVYDRHIRDTEDREFSFARTHV